MGLVNTGSLAETLNNLTHAVLARDAIRATDRADAGMWIAGRLNQPGSYRGMPAPTGKDYHAKLKLFTGEVVGSRAGTGCKLGFEATWALVYLGVKDPVIRQATQASVSLAVERFAQETARPKGLYCCYSCSCAGWRALAVLSDNRGEEFLEGGLGQLSRNRDGHGRWRSWPFWYTLLALQGMNMKAARSEMQYAAGSLERLRRRKSDDGTMGCRRRVLVERILECC